MALRYPNKQELKKDNGLVKFAYKLFSLYVYVYRENKKKKGKKGNTRWKEIVNINEFNLFDSKRNLSFFSMILQREIHHKFFIFQYY